MSGVRAVATIDEGVGGWVITAHHPEFPPMDVTYHRGVPTVINGWSIQDPFGPSTCSLTFPATTFFEPVGYSFGTWPFLRENTNYDIRWVGPVPDGYPYDRWVWEGFTRSFQYSNKGTTVTLKGAMFQLDDYLAKPEYPLQPIPYETAIRRQFLNKPHLRLSSMQFRWPSWWDVVYAPKANEYPGLVPTGTQPGEHWSGLLTRDTGSWDPCLTGYIQSLLGNWYTDRGRFTLSLFPGRRPILHHRDSIEENRAIEDTDVLIHPLHPGVEIDLSEDWEMAANVFYGQSTSLTGEGYSGMKVIGDGLATEYEPLAASLTVDPILGPNEVTGELEANTDLALWTMRKEAKLAMQDGLTALDAQQVGEHHLLHFSHPGYTGSITLTSDVTMGGEPMHRSLILPGMVAAVPQFRNAPDDHPILLRISEVSWDGTTGAMTLQVDSKSRDKLTNDEIRLRGRDALSVPRMLIGGRYKPTFDDQLMPWNYAEGSGYIPSAPGATARKLFEGMPYDIAFPWTEWTKTRPPSNAAWTNCYISIGTKHANANENWSKRTRNAAGAAQLAGAFAVPVRMAAAGTIRLLQVAAYDGAGNVLKVPFHFSIYYQPGTNVQSMPKIPALWGGSARAGGYPAGQHYPFFPQAWEQYNVDGTMVGTDVPVAVQSAGLIQGWGNELVPAGYWPGNKLDADPPTGLLVDEEPWQFNLLAQGGVSQHIGQYQKDDLGIYAGFCYVMIYCDAQAGVPVYFLGRMYRQEPGTAA